jgi:hypothetical protein
MTAGLDPITRVDLTGGPWINVRSSAYGAVGDGSADDTVAIQAALNLVASAGAGTVFFPVGVFKITSTLTYVGTYANCLILQGDGSGRGPTGSVLKWAGSSAGTLASFKGTNNSVFRDFCLDGNGLAKYSMVLDFDSGTSVGSSGNAFYDMTFGGATGTGSANLVIGTSGSMTSETRLYNVTSIGYGTNATDYGIAELGSGNNKNIYIFGGSVSNCKTGIKGSNSGNISLHGITFGYNSVTDIEGSSTEFGIIDCESEGSTKLLTSTGFGNNFGAARIEGVDWNGVCGTDDIFIDYDGTLTLKGNKFYKGRTGSSVQKNN